MSQIFLLDIDGVLANFVQGLIDSTGWDITHDEWSSWSHHRTLGISDNQMWHPTNLEDWWVNLNPYPWALDLVLSLKEIGQVIYCTSPSISSSCPGQKIDWLRKHGLMGNRENSYQIGPHKDLFAKSGAILIDDYDINVSKFREANGKAILFPQPWNENRELKGDVVKYVLEEINDTKKSL